MKKQIKIFYILILMSMILTSKYIMSQLLFINILIVLNEIISTVGLKKVKTINTFVFVLLIYALFNEYYRKIDFYIIDLIKIFIFVSLIYILNKCIIYIEKIFKCFICIAINKYFR
jgi:hypothetical protein